MPFPSCVSLLARRLARIIGLLTIAAGLAGCSTVKLGYENLDRLAYWWLDRYLDFSGEQATHVHEDLARLHGWHRSEELPQIIALLGGMEDDVHADITPAQACAYVPRIRDRLLKVADHAMPAAVTLALSLASSQLEHLQRKYDSNNADFRNEWVRAGARERHEKRERQFLDRSEKLYGDLGAAQRAALRVQLERSVFDPQRTLGERQRRQRDALSTLSRLTHERPSFDEAQRLLRGYLERTLESPDIGFRHYQQAMFDEGCRAFAALHNSTTAAQREAAARRLRAYQRDLAGIMRK